MDMGELLCTLTVGASVHGYVVDQVIGEPGGVSVTYKVHDEQQRVFALKELLPAEFVTRAQGTQVEPRSSEAAASFRWARVAFENEARILMGLQHSALMRVFGVFEENGTVYAVLEYCQGETLERVLVHEGQLSESLVLDILTPIAEALAHTHASGFIHRDIKLDNIIIRPDSGPVLIDFGGARQALRFKMQRIGDALASGYAAPESYLVTGKQGAWTDVYGLAAIAYRAVTGRRPVDAAERTAGAPLPGTRELADGDYSQAFLGAIDWGMQLDPTQRPKTIEDWYAALIGQGSVPAAFAAPAPKLVQLKPVRAESAAPAAVTVGGKSGGKLVALAAVLVVGAAAAWFAMTRPEDAPAVPAGEPAAPSSDAAGKAEVSLPPPVATPAPASEPEAGSSAASDALFAGPSLDHLGMQLIQRDQQAREAEEAQRAALEKQLEEEERRLKAEQKAAKALADSTPAAASAPAVATTKPSSPQASAAELNKAAEAAAAAAAAAARAQQLEREIAALKAEREARVREQAEAAQKAAAVASPKAIDDLPSIVDDPCPAGCSLILSDLFGPGRMNYERLSRSPGVQKDASGTLRTPPIKDDDGGVVVLEVKPNGCVRTRDPNSSFRR